MRYERNRVGYALGLVAAAALGTLLAGTWLPARAAPRPEFRVIPVNTIPFGERGATEYQALLERLAGEGWSYDHGLPGFVVFRR